MNQLVIDTKDYQKIFNIKLSGCDVDNLLRDIDYWLYSNPDEYLEDQVITKILKGVRDKIIDQVEKQKGN